MSKEYDHIRKNTKSLNQIEAILHRPDIDLGSIVNNRVNGWIYSSKDKKMIKREYDINYALMKIIDEIISNISDANLSNPKLNKGDISMKGDTIIVSDNGGIPVEKNEEGDYYVTSLFGKLNTGTNYDDDVERYTIGKFGKGSKLTNIFSKRFKVTASDGKNTMSVTWTDNMSKYSLSEPKKSKKRGTIIEFDIDFERFSVSGISEDLKALIHQRVIVASATNPQINYSFNSSQIKVKSFKDYLLLFGFDSKHLYVFDHNPNFIWGGYPKTEQFEDIEQISFVNGSETKKGGSHIDLVKSELSVHFKIMEDEKTKENERLSYQALRGLVIPFVCARINQPTFASQSKVLLSNNSDEFSEELTGVDGDYETYNTHLSNIKKLYNDRIVKDTIKAQKEVKKNANRKSKEREANRKTSEEFRKNFIDCSSDDPKERILFISEGDSASIGFQKIRNPRIHAAYKLGGKVMNVTKQDTESILKSKKIQGLATIIGLKYGRPPRNLNFGKIYINVDADPDGISIAGVLMNYFHTYWAELFDQGKVFLIQSPAFRATKNGKSVLGYNNSDMKEKENQGYNIEYFKGLSSLPDDLYHDMIHNPKLLKLYRDSETEVTLNNWFSTGNSDFRKEKINELNEL